MTRLSINLGLQPTKALRHLMGRLDISATEAIRRAISVWKFVEDTKDNGGQLLIRDIGGRLHEVTFDPEATP